MDTKGFRAGEDNQNARTSEDVENRSGNPLCNVGLRLAYHSVSRDFASWAGSIATARRAAVSASASRPAR